MDDSLNEVSNAPMMLPPPIPVPCVCKVCGDSAQYSYYGAVVCHSCKVFFRRNAQTKSRKLRCRGKENCEINVRTRRSCPYCRLAKCFSCGMHVELIRGARSTLTRKRTKNNPTTPPTSTALVIANQRNQPSLIRPLNLLRADQSTLSIAQWNQISNLVHCFDNYSGLPFIQTFIDEQTALPPKFRFRYPSVRNFFSSMLSNVQLVFERNRDYITLSLNDRTTLLHHTLEHTTSMGAAIVLRQAHLFESLPFFESAVMIFRPEAMALIKRLIDQLDPDVALMKMVCAVVAFALSNYTYYSSSHFGELTDLKAIMRIQDMYTDLVWRYLLYKHNHYNAVLCFSNLIRCLFLVNGSVVEAHEARQYTALMNTVMETTERNLTPSS